MRTGDASERPGLKQLIRRIAETITGKLGAFLLLEIWSAEDQVEVDETTGEIQLPGPSFRILPRRPHSSDGTVATLEYALQQIRVHRKSARGGNQSGR